MSEGPVKPLDIFDDFDFGTQTAASGWQSLGYNGGSPNPATVQSGTKMGRLSLVLGTNAAGGAAFRKSNLSVRLGEGAHMISFGGVGYTALDDGTDTYFLDFGFSDEPTSTEHTDALILRYSRAVSVNWQAYAIAGGAVTGPTDTGVVVTTADIDGRIVVNSNASRVDYYLGTAKVATITTNIPKAAQVLGAQIKMHKTGGTTTRVGYADYCRIRAALAR
jgi:hypothetical protein